jgi:pimeloyl-ACP methyl ester carboxylesterase
VPTVVFIHGACVRDAAWWWSRMTEPLAAHGIASAAVPLPSCGEAGAELGDLEDDVAAARAVIERAAAPVLLCGHSYGGVVATAAGEHPAVSGLVFIASVMPAEDESMGSIAGGDPAPWMDPGEDGATGVYADLVPPLFLQDCDADTVEAAVSRLTRQSLAPFGQSPSAVAWRTRPSTYVVCRDDLAIPAERQRERARRATQVVELETGHHPFLSRPALLADTLAALL